MASLGFYFHYEQYFKPTLKCISAISIFIYYKSFLGWREGGSWVYSAVRLHLELCWNILNSGLYPVGLHLFKPEIKKLTVFKSDHSYFLKAVSHCILQFLFKQSLSLSIFITNLFFLPSINNCWPFLHSWSNLPFDCPLFLKLVWFLLRLDRLSGVSSGL